jgi:hypothetical protein
MSDSKSELKPCPFCGCEPERWLDNDKTWNIRCCHILITQALKENANDAWNTRYTSEQVCEWTFCSALQVWQTECKITANLYLTVEHEYCLGCGKKIKVKGDE